MPGWANIDYGGQDPRFGDYYGEGYSGYDANPYLGYYGGYNTGTYAFPNTAASAGGYGPQRFAYPNVGSPYGSGYYGTDEYGYPFYGTGYGLPPRGGANANPTPQYPGFGPTTGYGRQMSGYLRGGQGQGWQQGPHAGKGPKRSDSRIQDEVSQRLTQHGQLDASNIDVNASNGVVTLTGTVDSRQAKRTADQLADAVPGVQDVLNRLTIQQGGQSGQPSQRQAQASGTVTRRTGSRASAASQGQGQGQEQQHDLPATIEESPPIVIPATGARSSSKQPPKTQGR
ncbi:MAG TPA: BON domain-containing protein [Thermomicrobiaceae bacterium]|nr:BON domain-containing protein [Thermomicrobiaceae bacterium]